MCFAFYQCKKFGVIADKLMDAALGGVIGGIIGARLYYVAFRWDDYKDNLMDIFKTWQGGMAIYGGLIGGLLVGLLIAKLRHIRILPAMDVAVMGFLIGQSVGRWGNFVNTAPVHPTFLYESLWCALGFVLLFIYSKRRRFDGEIFLLYSFWYGLGRFFIEGLRTDSLMLTGQIRVSQLLAGLIALAAAITWIGVTVRVRGAHDPEYLKPYVNTEAFAAEVAEYEEKLQKKSKKAKKDHPAEPEKAENGVEVVEIENFEGESVSEEPVDDGTKIAGAEPAENKAAEDETDGKDH